ncbi:MAG: cbb3-type cytochrome oxidase assembly protein CcoS [Candidatus Cloacimonetes bacterium]|nr:cbb3-type cytochrome oxidase assembly protein CcoS [Candidatus Cloacimonadota bacterium]
MEISFFLILISLGVALIFLGFFFWAVTNGQYEDVASPPLRILFDGDLAEVVTEREHDEPDKPGV